MTLTDKFKQSFLCIVFLLMAIPSFASEKTLAEIKLPYFETLSGMQTSWVAEKISYNGLPARILNFKSKDPIEDLFFKYESKWKTKGFNKVSRDRINGLRVLSIETGDTYYSVQGRDTADGGSEGSLVVSLSPLNGKVNTETDFPLYPNSEVVSKIESYDRGTTAETIIAINDSSVTSNFYWLKSKLASEGWIEQIFENSFLPENKFRQLNFQKSNQLCQITIVGDNPELQGKTSIVINWIK